MDLFSGLHGWSEPFVLEGYRVKAYDIVDMCAELGENRRDGIELFLRDVRTIHGSEFADAAVIVASPPCQKYSYMAMPWSRAKTLAAWYRESPERIEQLNELFNACFRIQREACEVAGRYIPLIVENVKGAQPWVGRAAWHFGSFYLWGDVPALMPIAKSLKNTGGSWFDVAHNTTSGLGNNPVNRDGEKLPGNNSERRWEDRPIQRLRDATKVSGQNWSTFKETGVVSPHWRMQSQNVSSINGLKINGPERERDLKPGEFGKKMADGTSKSLKRKAASAQIARIPFPLAQHIARCFKEKA